jgi:GntR family transcriptional repressor for pyruvate dehydrogenase complex
MLEKQSFKPVRTKRAFEDVCEQIRSEIHAGTLVPGDKLPSERELAETFQVSRSTVREAFRTLEIGGVLSLQKGVKGGATVMEGNVKPITQTMEDLLSLGGISLQEYTEARVVLQREIIRMACERAGADDFAALEKNIAEWREHGSKIPTEERFRLTRDFYGLLAGATKNRALSLVMSAFTEPLSSYLSKIGPDRKWNVANSREKFLKHLRDRDAESAICEMVLHMERLHSHLLSDTSLK